MLQKTIAILLPSLMLAMPAEGTGTEAGVSGGENQIPRVLIFNGLPGDEEHHRFFEENLGAIRSALLRRFRLPPERVRVFYGPESAGYEGVATRERVLAELEAAVARARDGDASPVWLIFHGHANRIPGGANLNLPGPDLSSLDLRRALGSFPEKTPLVILATTASSADFLKALSAPGRIVIAATGQRDPESETEFPVALAAALDDPETDGDEDGTVTVLELFRACQKRVLEIYESEGFMVREHAQLDGNGDGRGTQRPADEDAEPASRVALLIPGGKRFD